MTMTMQKVGKTCYDGKVWEIFCEVQVVPH